MNYLGLDVGATQCRHEWWPEGSAPGGDHPPVPAVAANPADAATALASALLTAARDGGPAAAVCAVAGVGDRATGERMASALRAHGVVFPVAVVGDVLAAAAAGLRGGPGLLIWSGTGSFAVARGRDGSLVRTGGRGAWFGDEGSAFDLVRRAIVAVLQAVDGIGPSTALTSLLTEAFGAPAPARLGAVAQRLTPREIAAKLPVVLRAYTEEDEVAARVFGEGVFALHRLADAALRRVGLDWRGLHIALGGGALTHGAGVRDFLTQLVTVECGEHPQVEVLPPRAAAHAAAWLAHGWHTRQTPQHDWVERVAL